VKVRRRFGQHFLAPAWADKVVDAIAPSAGDRFLEIGPGPGVLTTRLAARAAHVTAVEIDSDLASSLRSIVPPNVDVVVADILDVDLSAYGPLAPVRIAGNLPYNISSPILFKLLAGAKRGQPPFPEITRTEKRRLSPFPESPENSKREPENSKRRLSPFPAPGKGDSRLFLDATLMLQREVADRLAARPGTKEYGVLTIFARAQADVQRVLLLPPGAFRPAPKVHSAVVRLTFKPSAVPDGLETIFGGMVRSMFTQRRKTVLNALRPFAASIGSDAGAALSAARIDPGARPETLDQDRLLALARGLTQSVKPKA
jgi:16S rRNA (adenine1518-N6/adenine1519-N6)-dimethyltransferase